MRRGRNKNREPNPTTLDDFEVLPDRFLRTFAEEKFLIYDSGKSEEWRILVFGTRRNLQLLNKSRVWFLDGTFKVSVYLKSCYSIGIERGVLVFQSQYSLILYLITVALDRLLQLCLRKFLRFSELARDEEMIGIKK